MKTKKCHKCDTEKEIKEFGKDKTKTTGIRSTCKQCGKNYDSERTNTSKRKAYMKKISSDYIKSGKAAESDRRYRKRNPKKHEAHKAASSAIKNGKLIKQPCEKCGELKVYAHHNDYDKHLDISWLCYKHHNAWHKENGEGLNAL